MANQNQSMYANSTIACSVIVIPDNSNYNCVKVAGGATVLPTGVSNNGNRTRPDPDFTLTTQAQQIAAIAGEEVAIWVDGAVGVDLYCNYAWNAGDLIMSDSNGYGILSTSGNYYVGRAQTAGTVGALCPVDVLPGYNR